MPGHERFLRNAWYVAAWSSELTNRPTRRLVIGEPVALFRTESGSATALLDICPHRLVPLSMGSVVGDQIQCLYHGLRFDTQGRCTHNPWGGTPAAARVRSYRIEERYGIAWIWMGEAEAANADAIPDFTPLGDTARFTAVRGYTYIEADYELVLDNLMDLSHVEFLHPGLRTAEPEEQLHETRQEGDAIWSMRWRKRGIPNRLMQNFWPAVPSDVHMHMRWTPPCNLYLDVGVTGVGRPESEGVATPFAHLLTPAGPGQTHYFWASIRDARRDDPALDDRIRELANAAFVGEDKPVIEAQQANRPHARALGVRPILLAPDGAAVRVQRVLDRLLAAEREGVASGNG